VVADGLHRLGGGVTAVGASALLEQFPVIEVQVEWFIVPELQHQLQLQLGVAAIIVVVAHLLPLWMWRRGGAQALMVLVIEGVLLSR
jgi:hypothetical protein